MDTVGDRLRKRKGYQGFAGGIPVRVQSFEQTASNTELCLVLDSSIDLTAVRSSPLVVYGRSSDLAANGPFTTAADSSRYYAFWTPRTRKTFSAATTGSVTVSNSEHQLSTGLAYLGVVESTSFSDLSNSLIDVTSLRINRTTYLYTLDYTNSGSSPVSVIPYYLSRTAVAGTIFVGSNSGASTTFSVASGATTTHTITAGNHGLTNFNIVARVYQTRTDGAAFGAATEYELVRPDTLTVDPSTGSVAVTITNGSSASQNYFLILSTPSLNQVITGSLIASATSSVTIEAATSPFTFLGCYVEQTPGGILEEVIPDSVTYDADTQDITISLVNGSTTARNVVIYYEYGVARSNQLCVTDALVATDHTDSRPQLTVWGLDHSEIYGEKENREGWVTHLDSYRRQGEERLVSGLGGNIFAERLRSEISSDYRLPVLYPNLLTRTASTRKLGPLIYDTGDTPARTRGYITSTSGGSHWALVTSVTYNSSTGFTEYVLSLPSKAILDSAGSATTLGSVISTTSGLEDWLTVTGMSYERQNGTFRIRSVTDGSNQITVAVENDDVTGSDWDDSGTHGLGGIFTDQLVSAATSTLIPGDVITSEILSDDEILTVVSASSTTTVVDGLMEPIQIPGGIQLGATRTSRVVPMRTALPSRTASVTNLVQGDMLTYPDVDRQLRVVYVNSNSDLTVDITGDGETATGTLTVGNTDLIREGARILLLSAGVYSGVVEITEILSSTQFTFSSEETTTVTGATLLGRTVELDEEFEWSDTTNDSTSFTVIRRWIPVEAPDDNYGLTPSTYVHHLDASDYDNQSFTRSVMVADNLYLTNGDDEVVKFDGSNLYRAGLIPWQPDCFLVQDTSPSALITILPKTVAYSARDAATGRVTVADADLYTLAVGTRTRLSGSSTIYTVSGIDDTSGQVIFSTKLDSSVSASGNISEVITRSYYFRLNAIDENGNLIASAVTGSSDHTVELTASAQVRIRLVGLPAWDIYDYDKLEVEVYATRTGQSAPFYHLTTQQMTFASSGGYVDITDSFQDTDLVTLDPVVSALKGEELGTAWGDPLRARYVTTAANSLVLANLRDYPELDIRVVGNSTLATTDFEGKKMTFRRSHTASGTVTDMLDTAVYEWRPTSASAAAAVTAVSAGSSFTVTSVGHGLAAGNWVYLYHSSVATTARSLIYSGWWQVATTPTADTFTVNFSGTVAGVPTDEPDRMVTATNKSDIPVLMGTDGNFGQVNGNSTFAAYQAMRRMSIAINATMRKTDTAISGFSTFRPWLVARAGNEFTTGQLIVRQPRVDSLMPELLLPSSLGNLQIFVNEVRRSASAEISAETRIYPSRILASYQNYPEIFDAPTAVLDTESDSAIDVNPADGQEITGVIPFFGTSAFGASQESGIIVVFKTNSIYLVDLQQKRLGQNPVQRIETEGLGCTAPYSIAATKRGIVFANESGIYSLGKDLSIRYLGRLMERKWIEEVDRDYLDIVQGHHYGIGRQYKLSVPILDSTTDYRENSQVYVYDHTEELEGQRLGSWTRYDNHPATGWANLSQDAYFSTTSGMVYSIRRAGDETDYRDDSDAITARITYRAMDAGNSGIRKVLSLITAKYRVRRTSDSTVLSVASDLDEEFTSCEMAELRYSTDLSGIGDETNKKVISVSYSPPRDVRRGIYHQLQWVNDGIDEDFELAGFDLEVAGLTSRGLVQAGSLPVTTED